MTANIERPHIYVRVNYGMMVAPLKEQLNNYTLKTEDVEHWQKDMEAINRLKFRNVLTEGEAKKGYDRLNKAITEAIRDTIY